ncbi:hypothetical protein [Shewanella sp. NIFS-20-20]|uniref:hypothetical protein n=1 Tax=Shewanella sp. NIFS-20-20 TaxID=2853806 RepID=UPI001C49208E|nr:hypothetical protein [Shewanella sp. NIFS-20-20]MBV7314299.1 hypothetical protein [Shewanella sp. NIFS-20-20]
MENCAWIFVGSGPEGQALKIKGINVWQHQWQRAPQSSAVVSDPSYGQQYQFAVYQIVDDGHTIEFAAGEFSNNVWVFYVPAP